MYVQSYTDKYKFTTKTQTMRSVVKTGPGQYPGGLPRGVVPVTGIQGAGVRVGVLGEVEGRTASGQAEPSTALDRCDVGHGESGTLKPKGKPSQLLEPEIKACVFTPHVSLYCM